MISNEIIFLKSKEHEEFIYNDIAQPVPDAKLVLHINENNKLIEVVYAEPASYSKGLVILLHACTHNALKLFSPSPACDDCVGLSEEIRMVRLILERGYTAVAISSNNEGGCWSSKADLPRIETLLQNNRFNIYRRIIAVGASSGGYMAAELLAAKKVQASLVMVMGLSSQLISKLSFLLKNDYHNNLPILYLAPMPNDKGTTKRVIQNHKNLSNGSSSFLIALDTTTCVFLPLTPKYLLQRVPCMIINDAENTCEELKENKYLHSITNIFLKKTTNSQWRKYYLLTITRA